MRLAYLCRLGLLSLWKSCSNLLGLFSPLFILLFVAHDIATIIVAEAVVSVNLLKLRAKTFLCFRRWEHNFELLDGFSDFLLVAGVVP